MAITSTAGMSVRSQSTEPSLLPLSATITSASGVFAITPGRKR
jgi:hypothetical protein